MKVIAHRGYSGAYPENTMLAFRKAAEVGCDGIELDIQLTSDGTVVITHDETVDRVTEAAGFVKDFSFRELGKLDASGIFRGQYGFNPIPSLDEYLSWVKGTGLATNIELKNDVFYYEDLADKAVELVRAHGLEERVMFSSFNHPSLFRCKELAPEIPCGAIVSGKGIMNAGYYVRSIGLDCYHPDRAVLDSAAMEDCKKHGVRVNVFTVNGMADLLQLHRWNCDGIFTNYPDICKAWLDAKAPQP